MSLFTNSNIKYASTPKFLQPTEGIGTHFTVAKGSNGTNSVKFNALTTDDCVTISMRLRRYDEADVVCTKKAIQIGREHCAQIS